jgi:transcriptional regulator with XRE-family HTH domain
MAARRNKDGKALSLFADVLKEARHKAGLSSDELGAKLGYSGALIRSIESDNRSPKPELAKAADEFFGYPKVFQMMEERLRDLPFPESYRPFVPHERAARVLRIFTPNLVPGLFQTPEYARAVLSKKPHTTKDELENLLSARLARQEILTADAAPLVYAVTDETALHRQLGSADVMREQLLHLVEASQQVNITLQVIPLTAGAHIGLQGGCVIAEAADRSSTVFQDNISDGQVSENEDILSQVTQRFEALRADALSQGASADLIRKIAEELWKA